MQTSLTANIFSDRKAEIETTLRKRPGLPRFSGPVLLFTLGLLLNWFTTGGEVNRFWLLSGAIAVFWIIAGLLQLHPKPHHLLGLGTVGLVGVISVLTLPRLDDDYLRLNSLSQKVISFVSLYSPNVSWLTMHRNTLAGLASIFAVLALAYCLLERRWRMGLITGMFGLLMLVTLLLTNSRGGLVAFASGVVLLGLLSWPQYSKRLRLLIAGGGAGLICLVAGYLLLSGQYRLFSPERLLNENGTGRLEIWKNVIYLLGEVPFTGLGPGRFQALYLFYLDPTNPVSGIYQEHAHNLFLQSYVELGLPGLAGIIWATLSWLLLCIKVFRGKAPVSLQAPVVGGLAAFGTMLCYGVAEHSTWNGILTPFFWVPLAFVAGATPAVPFPSGIHWPKPGFLLRWRNLVSLGLLLLVVGLIGWQFFGLAQVNAASLEKLKVWQQAPQANLESVQQLYSRAEAITGWTGIPARGMAWVALQSGQPAQEESELRRVLQYDPGDKRSLLLLGDLFDRQGRRDEALDLWRQAQAGPIFIWRGRRYMDSTNDLPAEPYFKAALQIDPHLWDGYAFLEMLYQRHGRTREAVTLMEQATLILPGDPRPEAELISLRQVAGT